MTGHLVRQKQECFYSPSRKSQLLEDVYAYNDYSYAGRGAGCENRAAVTPDTRKGYLISEFGGQNFPAKPFDDEPPRQRGLL